ncbi:hypothetical protein ACI3LZ_000003 [Candidozyma auris]
MKVWPIDPLVPRNLRLELDTNKLRRGTIQGGVCWVTERWPGGHELQCHTGGDGSFAYDLDVQRGIVSGRVALLLRSAEIKPSLSARLSGGLIQLSELDTNKLRRGTIQGGVCWVTERWPGGHELQCHTGGDGSFAYDLDVQRGIVSGRVALLLRSAEIKPSLSARLSGGLIQLSELDTNKLRRGTIQGGVCWVTERWPGGHELQCHTGGDGSFAYDLDVQRGIVSGRVALLLRSAEIKPSLSARLSGGLIQLSELDTNKLRRGTIQGGVCWVTERWPGGHELQCHTGGDGSFAYDLDVQRGIVSGRVALLLRSAEIKPSLSARLSGGLIQLSELDTNKLRRGTIQGGVCWVTERWPGGHELQCHTGGDGSFAYDLDVQRGIVSGRVALLLRSAEIKPSLSGLYLLVTAAHADEGGVGDIVDLNFIAQPTPTKEVWVT